jgi:hypothetical protein
VKSVKLNLAEVVAKAEKAFKTSEAIKKSAVQLQKMADTARLPVFKPGQPPVK